MDIARALFTASFMAPGAFMLLAALLARESNGGDLRIGLPRQSLHDGDRWVHEPLRLTVVIDAEQEAIESVIRKHLVIQQLIENSWLHLSRFEQSGFERFSRGAWEPLALEGA